MKCRFLVVFAACILAAGVYCADDAIPWCYHDPTCNYTTWPTIAAPFCNGTRQSPIDIDTSEVTEDGNLTDFSFTNFNNDSIFDTITNTGRTVKVDFKPGVQISGGGLSEAYDGRQFHLHWGNRSNVPGSEHTIDGVQFAMELHIVNARSSLNGNTTLAIADPNGFAALGFLVEVDPGTTDQPASWKNLTDYLRNITLRDDIVPVMPGISLDDLVEGVDRTQYYRYLGSLTTPGCYEAVIWTVFKNPVRVSANLIDMFSTLLHINTTNSSEIMVNVFRGVQMSQAVTTRVSGDDDGTSDDASSTCVSLGLLALSLVLASCY
ncbi:carbonic anhydrase 4-like [Vanacampus margaritifer]